MSSLPPEVAPHLDQWLGAGWDLQPLAGDASVRAYYRVAASNGATYVLTYYPDEVRAQLDRSLAAYAAISAHVPVARLLHHGDAFVLQEDAGDRTLYDVLHEDREQGVRLYRAAIGMLAAFQRAPDPGLSAPFDAAFFFAELEMAREFYVEHLMAADGAPLRVWLETIAENISHHPVVLCHRDYHGQNIHVVNSSLYLLDYQDLRLGPDTYDVASLLRDRGVAGIIGDEAELDLLDEYAALAQVSGDVRRRYFETLLQRSIKILGTFSKQPIVRARMHYLDFIPPTIDSIRRCIDELPEYAPLRDLFPLDFSLEAARSRARELNRG